MCTVHTHTKCKLNSWCIGFSLALSVNLDCEKVSTVSRVLSMVSTGLRSAVCHCLASDRHLGRRLFPADESAMTVINWDFTFGGRAGCARCQEVQGSELKLCALAEGQTAPLLLGEGRFGCSRSEMCRYSHNRGIVPRAKTSISVAVT